jgi:nucleotide-binding universal stress UspA family protein
VSADPLPACRRLVVGSDLSPAAAAALRLATGWARSRSLSVRVVLAAPEEVLRSAGEELSAALHEQAAACAGRAQAELVAGDPEAALRERAEEDGTWLAVGSEGSAAESLRRTGRVASALVLAPPCPVLVAPPRWRPTDRGRRARPPAFERVLVALAGSGRDEALLRAALALAGAAAPMAAHVVDLSPGRCHPPRARAIASARAEGAAEAFLASFLDLEDRLVDVGQGGPDLPLHLVHQGPPHVDLAGLAESQSADLVVLGGGPTASLLAAVTDAPLLVLP